MPKPKRLILMLFVVALLLLAAGWLTLRLAFPPFVPPPLPQPNGYDDLLRAAEMLAPRTGWYPDMGEEELAAVVEHNQPALALARKALEKECGVPLDWSADETWLGNVHLPQIGKPREVARAFAAAALIAHRNGETQSAIDFGFDNIRLGQAAAKGGLAIDGQIGYAIYSQGLMTLRDQVEQLSRGDCQNLLNDLLKLETVFESPVKISKREQAFFHATHGSFVGTYYLILLRSQTEQTLEMLQQIEQIYTVMRTLLHTHLAIRLFQLDDNRLPESLNELVPKYLQSVPQDPFATGPLTYRPSDVGYVLYSIGPNSLDDGGIERNDSGRADLLLEPREASVAEIAESE